MGTTRRPREKSIFGRRAGKDKAQGSGLHRIDGDRNGQDQQKLPVGPLKLSNVCGHVMLKFRHGSQILAGGSNLRAVGSRP